MDRLKIYVFGFAHSGTTILKKIIGDHSKVYEVMGEVWQPPAFSLLPHLVFKCPILPEKDTHMHCKKIMIMKNPYDIFGGYRLRYGDDYLSIKEHKLGDYMTFVRYFLHHTDDYKIRYEDLFNPGEIEKMFSWIGLEYEGIKNRNVYCARGIRIPNERPESQSEGANHGKYRTWQINQPFRNMTGESAKHLPKDVANYLKNHITIQDLYSDYEYLA